MISEPITINQKTNKSLSIYSSKTNVVGDFYWAYADILRGIGINESTYDQRIMAFMALKLLVDNKKVKFNFDYRNNFGLDDKLCKKYKGENSQQTFLNLIRDIRNLGQNLLFFQQKEQFNPDGDSKFILEYMNHKRTFSLIDYVLELEPHYFEMVLDIYNVKADFTNYPREQYKDLYEVTIARMKKLSGDLTGQHFTQKSIIHLMCASVLDDMKASSSDVLAIYDPTCGVASMLMEAADYFNQHINKPIHVFGQEYHGQTWFLAKVFLEICGIENIIAYGNTLTQPAFNKINGNNSFDFIIANPPFGVDWKHDYDEVLMNMRQGEKSNFLTVKDSHGKFVTPKKSDGQFLFLQHILKLLKVSKKANKHAKAAIISSSTLASTGKPTGAEAQIRMAIFKLNYLYALLEQPNSMFTNTDTGSSIWFFDNQHDSSKVRVIKAQNDEIPLFIPHPNGRDKMKSSYSNDNILRILTFFNLDEKFVSKKVDTADSFELNVSQIVGRKDLSNSVALSELFAGIEKGLEELCAFKGAFK